LDAGAAWYRADAAGNGQALNDINVVDAPAFTGDATVTSHPPAQYSLDNAPVREIHHRCVDKSDRGLPQQLLVVPL